MIGWRGELGDEAAWRAFRTVANQDRELMDYYNRHIAHCSASSVTNQQLSNAQTRLKQMQTEIQIKSDELSALKYVLRDLSRQEAEQNARMMARQQDIERRRQELLTDLQRSADDKKILQKEANLIAQRRQILQQAEYALQEAFKQTESKIKRDQLIIDTIRKQQNDQQALLTLAQKDLANQKNELLRNQQALQQEEKNERKKQQGRVEIGILAIQAQKASEQAFARREVELRELKVRTDIEAKRVTDLDAQIQTDKQNLLALHDRLVQYEQKWTNFFNERFTAMEKKANELNLREAAQTKAADDLKQLQTRFQAEKEDVARRRREVEKREADIASSREEKTILTLEEAKRKEQSLNGQLVVQRACVSSMQKAYVDSVKVITFGQAIALEIIPLALALGEALDFKNPVTAQNWFADKDLKTLNIALNWETRNAQWRIIHDRVEFVKSIVDKYIDNACTKSLFAFWTDPTFGLEFAIQRLLYIRQSVQAERINTLKMKSNENKQFVQISVGEPCDRCSCTNDLHAYEKFLNSLHSWSLINPWKLPNRKFPTVPYRNAATFPLNDVLNQLARNAKIIDEKSGFGIGGHTQLEWEGTTVPIGDNKMIREFVTNIQEPLELIPLMIDDLRARLCHWSPPPGSSSTSASASPLPLPLPSSRTGGHRHLLTKFVPLRKGPHLRPNIS